MAQRGAYYIRVSTDDQTEFSPDAQLRLLNEYAKKNDIVTSEQHIYIDEGVSGRTAEKRPAFLKMIATAKSKPKPFDVILVHKFDRFARSREDSVVYKSLLKKEAGISVVSITESIEEDKFSVILEAMLEAMAEYYSLNLAEEVKKGMTQKALRGEYQTTPPFGYELVDQKLVVVPAEAEQVNMMFRKFASGQMGLRALAQYVNELGFRTKRGNLFENRTIAYILQNPVYIGKVRWTPTGKVRRDFHHPDTIVADGEHQPIVAMDLWERAQWAMDVQKKHFPKRSKPNASLKTWLKGLVRCGNCGSVLVSSSHRYLQCNAYAKGACKVSHCIDTKKLEELVLEQLGKVFEGGFTVTPLPAQQSMAKTEVEFAKKQLEKWTLKEERMKQAYHDGVDTLEEYRNNKEQIEKERAAIAKRLEDAQKRLKEEEDADCAPRHITGVCALLTADTVPMQAKHRAAHFLIKQIVYDKAQKRVVIEFR